MFWGRTFSAKDTPGNFDPGENKILANSGIRILPIARQVKGVGGSASDGGKDAKDNVAALLKAIPTLKAQGDGFYLFLHVEMDLSPDYYQGWHKGVLSAGGGLLQPCVYLMDPLSRRFARR